MLLFVHLQDFFDLLEYAGLVELVGLHEEVHVFQGEPCDLCFGLVLFLHFLDAVHNLCLIEFLGRELYQLIYEQSREFKNLLREAVDPYIKCTAVNQFGLESQIG